MDAGTIQRIETNVERAAAALLAGAVAFAVYNALHGALSPVAVSAAAGIAAVAGFLLCSRAISKAGAVGTSFPVPIFNVRDLEPFESDELLLTGADRLPDELVLTDADRLQVEELLLDDPLPALTDSRVVRLFDRKAMPTPGALQSRVDDHLAQAKPRHPPSDASQALAAALAELRQSLR